MTQKAPISILKAHLSRYLDVVKSGEEVIVTDRGRPVARLSPVDAVTEPDGRMAQLAREGRIRVPERSLPPEFLDAPRSADPEGESLEALLDERRQGR